MQKTYCEEQINSGQNQITINKFYKKDNIVAIASSNGRSGIGIIRISGTNLLTLVSKLTLQLKTTDKVKPRYAHYVDFINNTNNEIIDSGVLLYFPAPYSFTGEDVIELQGHGSPVLMQLLITCCVSLGCRIAEAGEFSKRAYLNGKIDLVQAESILDLINAESLAVARGAIRSLQGTFSKHINQINQELINLRMFVESTLDFPDEDIEFIANAKIKDKVINLQNNLVTLLKSTQQGVLLNNGINIVIVGRPNVGKSSLLNSLANEEIAIVTDIAGTTRDIIREKIIINGVVCNIIDTAGIRQTNDIVENIGIKRAIHAISDAQVCLILIDETIGITNEDKQILAKIPSNIPQIFVHNKIDLVDKNFEKIADNIHVYISAKHKIGLDILRNTILSIIGFNNGDEFSQKNNISEDIFTARTRHLDSIKRTISHIEIALNNWQQLEILAEELRYGHNALSEITGEFTPDDLLGEIFSKFCIGK